MQTEARFPPLHSPREHKDHTETPPGFLLQGSRISRHQKAWATKFATISLPVRPFHCPPPHPRLAQHSGKELLPRSDKQIPWSDPGAYPLLGDSAANQTVHAWHWPLSLTPAIPHSHPRHHTGSHLLWQTASLKLLTPVVLIQGVTGDSSLANRREEPISPSIHPSILPTPSPN